MDMVQITGFGGVFDILICTYFGLRLYGKYRKDPTNLYLKLFIRFFLFFDIFLVFTMLYVPDLVIPSGSKFLGIAFCVAFFFLFVVSAYAAKIVSFVRTPNLNQNYFFWAIIGFGLIAAVYFAIFSPPTINGVGGKLIIKPNGIQTFLMAIPVSVSFIAASYVFFTQGIKEKEGRIRSLLLGSSFVLWLIGGGTHPITLEFNVSAISDVVTSLGFMTAFIALIKKEESKENLS